MSHEDGRFDRLSGEPREPTADAQELVARAERSRRTQALEVGELELTGPARPPPARPSLLPWGVVLLLSAALGALLLLEVLPVRSSMASLERQLEESRERLSRMIPRVEELQAAQARLEAERERLLLERASLILESERRAGEVDKLRRAQDEDDAAKRRAPAAKSKRRRARRR